MNAAYAGRAVRLFDLLGLESKEHIHCASRPGVQHADRRSVGAVRVSGPRRGPPCRTPLQSECRQTMSPPGGCARRCKMWTRGARKGSVVVRQISELFHEDHGLLRVCSQRILRGPVLARRAGEEDGVARSWKSHRGHPRPAAPHARKARLECPANPTGATSGNRQQEGS